MPSEIQQKQTWHGDMVKAHERIHALHRVLGAFESYNSVFESERPAKDLFDDENVADKISRRLLRPVFGKGNDQVCQWLFDTYQTQDPELQLVVLCFLPILCGVYLPRVTTCPDEPLAGFKAVLLALYGAETKARRGRPVMINIPDLGHASLYHSPRKTVGSPQPVANRSFKTLQIRTQDSEPYNYLQGTGNKAAIKELERFDDLFNQYADKADDTSIGPDGIEALCDDLGVSPMDIRVLLLAWKLQAARQGYFSLEEWRKGLKSMRVDSLDKLKNSLPALQQEVRNFLQRTQSDPIKEMSVYRVTVMVGDGGKE